MAEADSYLSSEIACHARRPKRLPAVPMADYVFLPHTTDAYVQATGPTLEYALESAGKALFDTLCNLESIVPQVTEEIELNGDDEIVLLHDWLESLLLKFELENKVFAGFSVGRIVRSSDGLHATARISGEPYDKRKHGAKVEVKAVTYHKMEVVRQDGTTTVRFILDL